MDDLQQVIALCELKRHQLEKIIDDTKKLFKPWPKKNGGVKKQVKRDAAATESGPTAGERKQMAEVDKLLSRAAKARHFVRQKEEIEERFNLEQAQRQQHRQRLQDEQTSSDPASNTSTVDSISQKPGGGPKLSNGLVASSRGRDSKSNSREGERGSKVVNSSSRGVKGEETNAPAVISQSSLSRVLSAADDKEKKQPGSGRTVTSRPVLSKLRGSVSSASSRFKPAHETAPFKTQPDVKRRPVVGSRVRPGIPEVNSSRDQNSKQLVRSARPENYRDFRAKGEKQKPETLYKKGKSSAREASGAKFDSSVGLKGSTVSQDYTAFFCRSSENVDTNYGETESGFRSKSILSCEDDDERGVPGIRRSLHDSGSEVGQEEVVEDEEKEEEEQAFCLEKHGHAVPIPENLRRSYRKWLKLRRQVEAACRKREAKRDSVTSGFMTAMGHEIDSDVQCDPDLQELASLLSLTQTYAQHVTTLNRLRDEFNKGGELESVERVAGWHCIVASLLEDFASCAQDVRQATASHNPDFGIAALSERCRALLGPDVITSVSWLWNHKASSLLASRNSRSANGDAVEVLRYKTDQQMSHLYSILHDTQLAVMQQSLLHSWSSELLPQLDVQSVDPSVFRGLYGLLLDNGSYTSLPAVIYAPTDQAQEDEEEEEFSLS